MALGPLSIDLWFSAGAWEAELRGIRYQAELGDEELGGEEFGDEEFGFAGGTRWDEELGGEDYRVTLTVLPGFVPQPSLHVCKALRVA